ncbi:membrane integrity-associated transporter subunit PqiC [Trinickia terrae]|uniref:Membrane integrity-associated transporter subunit PqiC n=1 Tax=Trinickia terrae TaxID=2571161 RepID=A0A4V5PIC2_9BURK|nr:PqiC family protein [Trinickia terrae]TKC86820.1 membrane integrity-associated transporter subunit PqiC [Trinickia terrae]
MKQPPRSPALHGAARRALFRVGPAALLLGLAACASEPVHYHTLLAPSAGAVSPQQPVDFLIDVLPVGIPASLDQTQQIVRQGTNGMAVLDGERWASPFGEEMRGALSAELTRRLGTQDTAGLPPPGKPLLRIKVQVRRFDTWPGQRVRLDADWSLGFAADTANRRLLCHGDFDEPAGGSYAETVTAQQRAVAALAARIDIDARRWARSRSVACSQESSEREAQR